MKSEDATIGEIDMTILVLGNCQATSMTHCLRVMLPSEAVHQQNIHSATPDQLRAALEKADTIVSQPLGADDHGELVRASAKPIYLYPRISFPALQPDYVRIESDKGPIQSPLGNPNSVVAFFGWRNGLRVSETVDLLREDTFAKLGWFDLADASMKVMEDEGKLVGLELPALIRKWLRRGVFLHTINHPKLFAMADIARFVCRSMGRAVTVPNPEDVIADPTLSGPVWPVYPEIAQRLGIDGSHTFKMPDDHRSGTKAKILSLSEFFELSFEAYTQATNPRCPQVDTTRFRSLLDRSSHSPTAPTNQLTCPSSANPYRGLPDFHYWRRSVAGIPPCELDPVVAAKFKIGKIDSIATAGSCFAQHIARKLQAAEYNYHIAERPPASMSHGEAARLNYGVYSARYGNVYTARQLKQLLLRSLGRLDPDITAWSRPDERIIDPFRPEITPDGFATEADMQNSRDSHLQSVRSLFGSADVFVFTLGLTEAWESENDGTIVPIAPGVIGSPKRTDRFRFKNFNARETIDDLSDVVSLIRELQPQMRFLLTVSPVPLVATYEKQHVLAATSYSKSVLRVAASELQDRFEYVDYFPSYEIITSQSNRGKYFEEDLRAVTPDGVDHVMRTFFRHYCHDELPEGLADALAARELVCEEERLSG